jgi:hypothetical protein
MVIENEKKKERKENYEVCGRRGEWKSDEENVPKQKQFEVIVSIFIN